MATTKRWIWGFLGGVGLSVLFTTGSNAQDIPQQPTFDWQSVTQVNKYISDTLKAKNTARYNLTERMIRRLSRGARVESHQLNLNDPKIRAATLSRFSPNSKDRTVRFFQSLGRTTYNNAIFVGRAGVGKTFVVDQLVLTFSLGVVPNSLGKSLGIGSPSPFYNVLREAFVGKTQFIMINDSLLQLDNTARGAAFANHETRVKGILHDIFAAAEEDFNKNKIRTVFVIEEARNLAPEVQPTLKSLLDDSGFKDEDSVFDSGGETGYSVLQLTTTEELALMLAVEGGDAIERRFHVIHFLEPSEVEAYAILKTEQPRLERRYGLKLKEGILHYIIENRRFFSNPPEAMPGGILKALERLYIWASNDENRKHPDRLEIGIEDAIAFKIESNQLPKPIWLPSDGSIPLANLEDKVASQFAGSEGIVRKLVGKVKALFRNGNREFPFFIVMGPPGSGKDTLVRLINQNLFGHSGRHLMFDFSNKDRDYIQEVLETTGKGGLPLLIKRQSLGSPHGIIAFNEVKDARFLEGIKMFAETGTLFPTGNDTRERPLQLNALFLMGQWGEELFEGVDESQYGTILRQNGSRELEDILMKGKGQNGVGALPRALVDRAFLTGGVFLLPPVKREFYPKIVRLHMDLSIVPTALVSKSVCIEYDQAFVDLAIATTLTSRLGTRSLEGIVSSFVDVAISKAIDKGMPETDVTAKFTADLEKGVLQLSAAFGNGRDTRTMEFEFFPRDLVSDYCEETFTPGPN